MSVKVAVSELADALQGLGRSCFLLTTNSDSTPHPAHVPVAFDPAGVTFTVSAGRRSGANIAERSAVTLLWPGPGSGVEVASSYDSTAMSLIVDGIATVVDVDAGTVSVEPVNAIWHRRPD